MTWGIKAEGGGYVATWNGEGWGMAPRSRQEAEAYVERLQERYPGGGSWLVRDRENGRPRGGPWRWTLSDGETGVIHTARLADAKTVLRHKLRRKRLPNGTEWAAE